MHCDLELYNEINSFFPKFGSVSILSQQQKADENTWGHLVWTAVIKEGGERQ